MHKFVFIVTLVLGAMVMTSATIEEKVTNQVKARTFLTFQEQLFQEYRVYCTPWYRVPHVPYECRDCTEYELMPSGGGYPSRQWTECRYLDDFV